MKAVSFTFLAVLLLAHRVGDPAKLLGLPLSMFRDGPLGAFGYVLFGLLLLAGGLMIVTLLRQRLHGHVCLFGLAAFLLLFVALTPSDGGLHVLASLVLLAVLFTYYAVQFHAAGRAWLWAHLAIPSLLVLATQFHSYGLWQKSFIVYFLLAVNVQHHLLTRGAALGSRAKARRPHRAVPGSRRRVVYVLDEGRGWSRQAYSPGSSV
jgi:hypothetical protein